MNELQLIFDREQERPLSIAVGVTGASNPSAVFRGMLQSYEFPKRVDYRLIKTFGGDNYIYFFGEEVPVLRLQIEFTDGTTYDAIKGWQLNKSYYDSMNILDRMKDPNSLFYGTGSSSVGVTNALASFIFNRSVFIGYILDIDTIGSVQKKGTLTTTMSVIVQRYYVVNINDSGGRINEAFNAGVSGVSGLTLPNISTALSLSLNGSSEPLSLNKDKTLAQVFVGIRLKTGGIG